MIGPMFKFSISSRLLTGNESARTNTKRTPNSRAGHRQGRQLQTEPHLTATYQLHRSKWTKRTTGTCCKLRVEEVVEERCGRGQFEGANPAMILTTGCHYVLKDTLACLLVRVLCSHLPDRTRLSGNRTLRSNTDHP